MRFILIRHGKTAGNLSGRYIGARTDEALCAEGLEELCCRRYPAVDGVFSSPMKRCRQTAETIYPDMKAVSVEGFRECDFGLFENLSYRELNGRADYQAWIDSNGEAPFPDGESRAEFTERCVRAFEEIVRGLPDGDYAMIVHGGTIMAIMERFAQPAGGYYDFQVRNAEGYVLEEDGRYFCLETQG